MLEIRKGKNYKKVCIVKQFEIERFCVEIGYRLRVKRLSVDECYQCILRMNSKEVRICELAWYLLQEPFLMESILESEKLARYLVEDNRNEKVDLDYDRAIPTLMLKSMF